MPLLKIDARDDRPVLHGPDNATDSLSGVLDAALGALPGGAPVVVMIHGFKFAPGVPGACPHRHILSLTPDTGGYKALSWPRHLGFGRSTPDGAPEGLCIAFGWDARGTIWRAWRQAEQAGRALAALVRGIRARRAGPVDILAHSLGARVALFALGDLPAHSIGRAILMMAAEYQSTAARWGRGWARGWAGSRKTGSTSVLTAPRRAGRWPGSAMASLPPRAVSATGRPICAPVCSGFTAICYATATH